MKRFGQWLCRRGRHRWSRLQYSHSREELANGGERSESNEVRECGRCPVVITKRGKSEVIVTVTAHEPIQP